MHALIVDLDLTLLAGEAGLVKEQLLRPHHLGLKDPASTSWAGIITAPLEKTWVRALRGWGWARCAVPAVDLLVLPHEHLRGDQYFQSVQRDEETWSLSLRGRLQVLHVKQEEWKCLPFSTTSEISKLELKSLHYLKNERKIYEKGSSKKW